MSDNRSTAAAGGGAIYGWGVLGAWFYFWPQADGFWEHVFSVLQGIAWPAYVVYRALDALAT